MIVLPDSRRERLMFAVQTMIDICEERVAEATNSLEDAAASDDLEEWVLLLEEISVETSSH